MKRLVMFMDTTPEATNHSRDYLREFAMAPVHWFARGPRGGIYEGTGPREMVTMNDDPDLFLRNMVRVYVRSKGAKYVRPGTKAYADAVKVLAQ
jgi:hypothetical protein